MKKIVGGIILSILLLSGCNPSATSSTDQNFLPLLANGEIQGFDISIGEMKEAVLKSYGPIKSEDFLDGGRYSLLEKLDHKNSKRRTDRRFFVLQGTYACFSLIAKSI